MAGPNKNNLNVYFPEPLQTIARDYANERLRHNGKPWGISYFLQIAAAEYIQNHLLNVNSNEKGI